jgi:hypothetical protein
VVADDGAQRAEGDEAGQLVDPLRQGGGDDEDHSTRERNASRLDEKGAKHEGMEVPGQEIKVRLKEFHCRTSPVPLVQDQYRQEAPACTFVHEIAE